MKQSIRVAVVAVLLGAGSLSAQAPAWQWVAPGTLTGNLIFGGITTHGIGVDNNGSVYFGGAIADTSILGPNTLASAGGNDIFLAKTNSSGIIQWSKRYGTVNADQVIDMIVDVNGTMYAQLFFGSPSFNLDGNIVTSLIFGSCVAKFDANGICTLAKTTHTIALAHGGLAYSPNGYMVAVNGSKIVKLNMNCDTIWTRTVTTGLNQQFIYYDVTIDNQDNIVACGNFGGSVQIGGATLTTPSTSDLDNFIVKFNASGTVLWAKQSGSRSTPIDYARSVAVNSAGESFLVGDFTSKVGFESDTLTNVNALSAIYLAKYASNGTYLWSEAGTSPNQDFARQVICDPSDNLWLAINPSATVTFVGQNFIPGNSGSTMLISIDSDRNYRSRLQTSALGITDPKRLVLDPSGSSLYVGGYMIASSLAPVTFAPILTINQYGCYLAKGSVGTPTSADGDTDLPADFTLQQNYPNPFNPTTTISYTLENRTHVSLAVYNIAGQLVRTLVSGMQSAGSHTAEWDGQSTDGAEVASGIYFYRLETAAATESRKMLLIR